MKNALFPALLGVNGLLAVLAGGVWMAGDTAWHPPPAQVPEPASLAAEQLELRRVELAALAETLERPLFAATRRPPPPVPEAEAEAPPPPPDPLKDVQLLGVFEVGADKHLMLRAEGKVTRLKVGEAFGPWTVRSLNDREVTFAQGDQQRQLALKHAAQPAGARLSVPFLGRATPRAAAQAPAATENAQGVAADKADAGANKDEAAAPPAVAPAPGASAAPQAAPAPSGRSGGSLAQRMAERRARRLGLETK